MYTSLTTSLFLFNALIFGLIALLHVYWAFGGSWAAANALPQLAADDKPVFIPGRLMTLLVAGALLVGLLLNVYRWLPSNWLLTSTIHRYGLLLIGLLFVLRTLGDFKYVGLTKRVRNTVFARYDTALYTPLCGALAMSHLACFIVQR
ncbi:DUF3995 domain-containing protein [uncultured Spirosoma sp.]|uniref:DUF3995 domain-containing protein n=1 Tax=uncultured Spirosoma sp. TaxID=278208 RepID=UPI00258B6A2E|nr:DUF3995 domain-containing protein [uncultured Spirosoma sp.]